MNIILSAVGIAGLVAGVGFFCVKDTENEYKRISSGGENNTNYGGNTNGAKAQALKNKPQAQDPMGVASTLINNVPGKAKMVAKFMGKTLPVTAQMALDAGKVAFGTTRAIGEFIDKKAGIKRKISGFMKPIKFKATSAAYFLKDQFETEGDRLKNRFNKSKGIIKDNINSAKNAIAGKMSDNTKRKLKKATSWAKFYSTYLKEKTIANKEDFKSTAQLYKDAFSQMATGISKAKQDAWRDYSSTKGYAIAQDGLRNIKAALKGRRGNYAFSNPANLLNLRFTANRETIQNAINSAMENDEINVESRPFTNESLTAAIREYRRTKGNSARDALIARRYAEALNDITSEGTNGEKEAKHKLLMYLAKNSNTVLDKEQLIGKTNEMYNFYVNNDKSVMTRIGNAKIESEKMNKAVTSEEIIDVFTSPENQEIWEKLKNGAENRGIKNEYFDQYVDIMAKRVKDNPTGAEAIEIFGEKGAEELINKLNEQHKSNIASAVVDKKMEITQQYMSEKGMTMEQASTLVENLSKGAFDQDSFNATIEHFMNNTTQNNVGTAQQGVQQPQQVVQQVVQQSQQPQQVVQQITQQTIVQQNMDTTQQQVVQQPQSNQATNSYTTTVDATSQTTRGTNISSGQPTSQKAKEKVVERIVENVKSSKIDAKAISKEITEDIRANTKEDIRQTMSTLLGGYLERYKGETLENFEKAISNSHMMDELYETIGMGNKQMGKVQFKQLLKSGGTVDQLFNNIQEGFKNNNESDYERKVREKAEKAEKAEKKGA